METQMYDVDTANKPEEQFAELRLDNAVRRIQEIDEEVEDLTKQREAAAKEINRATRELQASIEKAQHVLSTNVKPSTRDGSDKYPSI